MATRGNKLLFLYVASAFLLIVAALFHQEHLYLMAADAIPDSQSGKSGGPVSCDRLVMRADRSTLVQ